MRHIPTQRASSLKRRPVWSPPVETELIGKEGNKLEERLTGEVLDQAEYQTSYGRRGDYWAELVVPVLREIGAKRLAGETGFKIRSIYDVLNRSVRPHPQRRVLYETCAVTYARNALEAAGEKFPGDGPAVLRRYQRWIASAWMAGDAFRSRASRPTGK
jgi:hypothetical protein